MKIYNTLPTLIGCLEKWEHRPSRSQFEREFVEPMAFVTGDFFSGYYGALLDLDWESYRAEALKLDPQKEELRVLRALDAVESLFGFKLQGEIVIQGAFAAMDGYARFDRGTHKVYLGVDESHSNGKYLDVLIAHELTHVARESRPEVWEGFGLDPKMTHDEFTETQPVIEHLMGEGFSCAVSERIVPGESPWLYAYQSEKSFADVMKGSQRVDRAVKAEINHQDGDYGRLYRLAPVFSHYVWAWQWVKNLLDDYAEGDPRQLVARCSKEFIPHALEFELRTEKERVE